jgi:hypothetical protein
MRYTDARKTGLYVTHDANKPDILALLDIKERTTRQKRKYAIRHKKTKKFLFATKSGGATDRKRKADVGNGDTDFYLSDMPCLSTSQGCGIRLNRMKHPEDWEVVEIGFKVLRVHVPGDWDAYKKKKKETDE